MAAKQGAIRIGISGWRYKPWRGGTFYPDDLPQRRELEYASSIFDSIEINGTFYSLQTPSSFDNWAASTPDDFVFAVKGSRYITHMRRLKDVEIPFANFCAQGLLRLGKKLGPILWQFPERFRYDPDRFEAFFDMLPRNQEELAELAGRHDDRMSGRAVTEPEGKFAVRHAIEIRSNSFVAPDFIRQLRRHRIGLVVADTVDWPLLMDVTAEFVYCRLHGSEELYVSGYDDDALDTWATRIRAWSRGSEPIDANKALDQPPPKRAKRDVYVYFDNDVKVRAPKDAQALKQRL